MRRDDMERLAAQTRRIEARLLKHPEESEAWCLRIIDAVQSLAIFGEASEAIAALGSILDAKEA